MSKELTPLEAFYDLIDVYFDNDIIKEKYGITEKTFSEKKKIVETALKDYDRRLKLAKEYKDVNNVAKRLKALEIIKRGFDSSRRFGDYFDYIDLAEDGLCIDGSMRITKEEYELLKEVLL